ncbi:TetR family transcriptional regulator [Sphingomonas sanxanigenens]|uniref:TetR family transcriptional regulator n=1 Tax=Sphingomonas sanxanigenens TaxID=397260 RepID=UPI00063D3534|nr:TetR family transcriptional regulator [Sphingomonas sanxanigenens]
MSSRSTLISNAGAVIAAQGMRGLSLRAVAERAGISLGSLNYQIGDRAALVEAVIADGCETLAAWHDGWLARLAGVALDEPAVLASIILAYLEDAAAQQPHLAISLAELLVWAGQQPGGVAGFAPVVAEHDRFWTAALGDHPDGARLAAAIGGYCRDEIVFTLALRHLPEYRLLRDATVARLAAGFAPTGPFRDDALFDRLVAAAAGPAAGVSAAPELATEKRAAIAGWAADVIEAQGVAALTHRAVAAVGKVSASTIVHHFGPKDELLRAGLEAQYRRMTGAFAAAADHHRDVDAARSGRVVLWLTHIVALEAVRDPTFIPYAIDMRRRRSENVRAMISRAISGGPDLDRAAIQAAVIAALGVVLDDDALGRDGWARSAAFQQRIALRQR